MNDNVLMSNNQIHWARFMLAGSAVGLIFTLLTLFVAAILFTHGIGMSNTECVVYGCTLTMLLSQPVGLFGALMGLVLGALHGFISYRIHKNKGK